MTRHHPQWLHVVTTAERGALSLTADSVGTEARDTDLSQFMKWDGSAWVVFGPGADHGLMGGLGDDDHTQYALLAPLASARNVIAAATATIRPLAIQTTDDDATNVLTSWQDGIGTNQTTIKVDGSQHILVGNLQIGAGGAPPVEYTAIKTLKTLTTAGGGDKPHVQITYLADTSGGNLAGNVEGILLNVTTLGNNDITGGLEGIRFFANATGNGTVAVLNALRLFARADSASGTVNALTAGNINVDAKTGATVIDGKGINVISTLTGTATITDLSALYISTPTLGGTSNIVNHRGLYIEDINVADTLNYAIYTNAGDVVLNALGAANTVLIGATTDLSSTLGITATAATDIGQVIRLAAAQSADALQIQNSTPTILWLIEHDGGQVIQQAVVTTGGPTPSLTITSAAHTALTAGAERTEIDLDLSATQQWATGALATQRFVRIQAPTIAFVGASTVTDAITWEIGGAPIAGANATLTRTAAFVVASGNVVFGAASVAKTLLTVDGHISLTSNNEMRWYDNGNYVGFEAPALVADQIWVLPAVDGGEGDVLSTDGAGNLVWDANTSEKSWAFMSRDANTGTNYIGGYYKFAATANDFNPVVTFGTANAAYGAHFFLVQVVGAGGGDTTVQITGTSITDAGVRSAADTENLTVSDAGAAGTYYETTKKWIGQVSILKTAGPDLLCNYGFCKYWDDNNTDFKIVGFEATWLGAKNDATPDILLRHHKATGWTYNAGAPPTPPAAIAAMATDYNTEIEIRTDEEGAWKRDNLATVVTGSGNEGTMIELVTTTNRTYAVGNFLLRIVPQ